MTVRAILATAALGLLVTACSTMDPRAKIVAMEAPCDDVTVQVYFEPDSAEVTDEGRAVLSQAASQAKGCRVDRVRVLGLADAAGAPGANLELSKRRASSVTNALAAIGLPAAEFDLDAVGQSGAVTRAGDAQPLRRRADINVELSAR